MSIMRSAERVYDCLVEAKLDPEAAEFDDLFIGSMACAYDPMFDSFDADLASVIAEMDESRNEFEVALDLFEYFRRCGVAANASMTADVVAGAFGEATQVNVKNSGIFLPGAQKPG